MSASIPPPSPDAVLETVMSLLPLVEQTLSRHSEPTAAVDKLRKLARVMGKKAHKPYRKRGSPYPKRVCTGCAAMFRPRRIAGSSPTTKCDICREEEERQNRLRRGKRG